MKPNNNTSFSGKPGMLAAPDPGLKAKETGVSMACFKGPNLENIPSCRAPNFIQSAPKSRLRQHKSQPEVADTWLCIIHSFLSNPEMYSAGLELNGN